MQQAWVIMVFFFSYCRGAIFSYVYTPACATSIGTSPFSFFSFFSFCTLFFLFYFFTYTMHFITSSNCILFLLIKKTGCSFSDKIWNSTEPMTENDDVIIESNVSIIISIYSTSVSLATLVFGVQGSPVTINIVNSTVDLSGNTTLNGIKTINHRKRAKLIINPFFFLFLFLSFSKRHRKFGMGTRVYFNSV